jgi:SCP-2 sterol transfer family protein
MQSRDRPAPDIAVPELFERWLPDALISSGERLPAGLPVLRVSVSGAGGGGWDLSVDAGAMRVAPVSRTAPDVWVRLSVADLRVALGATDPDLPTLLPAGFALTEMFRVSPADVDLLRQVSGRLLVEIEGRNRRRWALDIGFGKAGVAAGRPRTTVKLDASTVDGLRTGAIAPMQALFDGRVKIEGDRALAMQLMLLVGSRFARR